MISSGSDFFPVGYKVRMPTVHNRRTGSSSGSVSAPTKSSPRKPIHSVRAHSHNLAGREVNELSRVLTFSDDAVSHISPRLVSYNKAKEGSRSLFKVKDLDVDIGSHVKKAKGLVGRHDCRGELKRHHPCHLQVSEHIDPQPSSRWAAAIPVKRNRSFQNSSGDQVHDREGEFFFGRVRSVAPSTSIPWQDQTLTKVSSTTARHLVGLPSSDNVDDDKKRQVSHRRSHHLHVHVDPTSATDTVTIDRDTGGEQETGSCHSDLLQATKDFVKELKGGSKPVHQLNGDGNTIVLSNDARFSKVLQPSYPHSPSQWQAQSLRTEARGEEEEEDNCVIGYRRWSDFPKRAKTPDELQWECQSLDVVMESEESKESCLSEVPSKRSFKNKELFDIMQEWCTKWEIHVPLGDIKGEESILDDLHNLCDNTKMVAIAAVAHLARLAATIKSKASKSSLQLGMSRSRSNATTSAAAIVDSAPVEVTEDMVNAVRKLLDDSTEHVRVPSAVLLYCLDKQCEKAQGVLLSTVIGGVAPTERWASVQVLVCARVCTAPVISELLHHLHDSQQHQSGRRERAAALLARSSANTSLVHSMLAEQLNCSGWQERLAACQMLPRLHGGINKDLRHKLVVLSWEDWSPEVRQAAAIALGQTGHAKMIHDEIANRLSNSEEAIRLDALKKLHNLHLMTSHLLPSFLKCFKDDHISVKIESIVLAGSLRLREPQVLQALHKLLQDPCWKVKAYTLRAFADIGVADDELVSKLLWAVRFEKLPAVRAEACHAIARLQLKQEKVIKTLLDLLIVEGDPLVLKEVSLTLKKLECSVEGEDDMLETIRSEVKRLGTREAIASEIVEADIGDTTDYVIRRPRKAMTTRDYLNDKHRNKVFLGGAQDSVHWKKESHDNIMEPYSKQRSDVDRSRTAIGGSWSPDRETIDAQLNEMKKRVSLDLSTTDTT